MTPRPLTAPNTKLVSMAQEAAVRGRPWRGPLGGGRPACAVTEGLGPRHGWRLGLGSGLSCTVTHAARALMASVCAGSVDQDPVCRGIVFLRMEVRPVIYPCPV